MSAVELKIRNLIADYENVEYYLHHSDDPQGVTEDLLNQAIDLALEHDPNISNELFVFLIKKITERIIKFHNAEKVQILIPKFFHQYAQSELADRWFNKYDAEIVKINVVKPDGYSYNLIINLDEFSPLHEFLKGITDIHYANLEGNHIFKKKDTYHLSCNSLFLVSEIINQYLCLSGAVDISLKTK